MLEIILKRVLNKKSAVAFLITYLILFVLWPFYPQNKQILGVWSSVFSFNAYGIVGIIGAINGFRIASKWGGWSSKLGKGIMFLSLGLLVQNIGLYIFSYYTFILGIVAPYPCWADLFYIAIIPFNALALVNLGYLAGAKFTLGTPKGKGVAIAISGAMIVLAYFLFLRNVTLDLSDPIKVFLDFAYPLGEAFVFGLALIVYTLTTKTLGGTFKFPMLFIIFYSLLVFLADYTFLYTASAGTYVDGSWVDFVYVTQVIVGCIGLTLFEDIEAQPV